MRLKGIGVAVLVGFAFPAAATAAPPLFSPAMPVGGDGPVLATGGPRSGGGGSLADLRVALARDGAATVAWAGGAGGTRVFAAERPPGGGAFSPPVELGNDARYPLALARNDGGVRAIAWPMKVAIAPAGGGFAEAEDIPVPPRAPPVDPNYSEPSRDFRDVSVAVATDGAVVVGYMEDDRRAQLFRSVIVVRHPDGSWSEPQILDDYSGAPEVIADGTGALHAMWGTAPRNTTDGFRLYVADAGPDGHFGPGRLVSNPDWRSSGPLLANRRGDLVVVWQSDAYGSVVGVTDRPAGDDWHDPEVIYSGIPYAQLVSGALNDRGDVAVAWTNGDAFARSRPAGGPWSKTSTTFVRQGSIEPYALGMDAHGTGLAVSSACRSEGTTDTIVASVLPRGGALAPVLTISPGVDPVSVPAFATDALGNGLAVWLRGPRNESSTVYASGYSAAPPAVSGFSAKAGGFGFKVTEPARVSLTVSGLRRRATQWSRVRRGTNTLRFSRKVRSLLKHHGRFKATIRARDAGPRASHVRTISFRR